MRLFVAIELNAEIRRMLLKAQRSLTEFDRGIRWVREEQMHLTLKFLGDVADGDVTRVIGALKQAASGSEPFELQAVGSGCFPPRGRARVIWVGLRDADGRLAACQRAVEDALADVGFPREERAFSPHLTLGRVQEDRSGGRLREQVEALEVPELEQTVESVVLMQSELHPKGARYTRLGRFGLDGGRA